MLATPCPSLLVTTMTTPSSDAQPQRAAHGARRANVLLMEFLLKRHFPMGILASGHPPHFPQKSFRFW